MHYFLFPLPGKLKNIVKLTAIIDPDNLASARNPAKKTASC
jgi:hypothetical protein